MLLSELSRYWPNKLHTPTNTWYPVSIPIKEYGVAVSTYTTGSLTVFDTGIQVPVEGFTYAIDSGYKKNLNCKEMKNYLDPANVTSDFYAALGDCTI